MLRGYNGTTDLVCPAIIVVSICTSAYYNGVEDAFRMFVLKAHKGM